MSMLAACGGGDGGDKATDNGDKTETTPAPRPSVLPTEFAKSGDAAIDAMRQSTVEVGKRPRNMAEKIKVQHVLIAFEGAQRSEVKRSKDEAEKLAAKVFEEAKSGTKFITLMQRYSTDPGGGEYEMTQDQMVKGFNDISFRLEVDEVGVAPYDEANSPFGWHVIKRLE